MKEVTDQDRKRKVITKIIQELSKTNIDMYYNSTSDTSNAIEDFIKEGRYLNKNEIDLVKDMTAREISLLLSLKH